MDLKEILENRINNLKSKKSNIQPWQEEALEKIKLLADGSQYVGVIMRWYKFAPDIARIAMNDTLELNKPFSRYFLKVCWSIRNQRKTRK